MRWAKLAAAAIIATPLAAWAFFKPLRVLAPELSGVDCYGQTICTDDPSRLEEMNALRAEAMTFVQRKLGKIEHPPRVIFCATARCEKAFGFTSNAAYNVGTAGLVVRPSISARFASGCQRRSGSSKEWPTR
jgi:hypothetical protein